MQLHPKIIHTGDAAMHLACVKLEGRNECVAGVPAGMWMGRIYRYVHTFPTGGCPESSQSGGPAKVIRGEAGNERIVGEHERNEL